MTLNRLQQIAETYGADPRRWPAAERAALEPLIGQLPARSILRGEQSLDQLLDSWRVEGTDWALERRILATAAMAEQVRVVRPWHRIVGWLELMWPGRGFSDGRRLWPQLAGLAAAAMIGFFVGISDFGTLDSAGASSLDETLGSVGSEGTWQ